MSFPSCVQRELFTDVMLSSSPPFSSHTHTVPSLFDYCLYSKHQGGSVTSYSTAPVKWTGSENEKTCPKSLDLNYISDLAVNKV